MNVPTKETYSELYSILNMMGEDYIKKLPENIYARIENERDLEYNPVYVKDVELEKQNVSEEALASISYFNLNFWSETIEEKAILSKLFANTEQEETEKQPEQQEQQLKEEDTPIEDNKDTVQIEENTQEQKEEQNIETETINQEETSLIIHKEGFFTRIINKIKEFFTRKKHKIDEDNEIEESQENKEKIAKEVQQEDNSDFQD